MKFIILFLLLNINVQSQTWQHDIDSTLTISKDSNRLILLNFSGSDWCIPCKKLKNGLFKDSTFLKYSEECLVLINADFPNKSNLISKEQVAKNEKLADKYNPKGVFPLTILLDSSGKELAKWSGLISLSSNEFINQLKKFGIQKK